MSFDKIQNTYLERDLTAILAFRFHFSELEKCIRSRWGHIIYIVGSHRFYIEAALTVRKVNYKTNDQLT